MLSNTYINDEWICILSSLIYESCLAIKCPKQIKKYKIKEHHSSSYLIQYV